MKKSILFIVLLGLVSSLVLVGCEKKQEAPPVPAVPTNAPAAP